MTELLADLPTKLDKIVYVRQLLLDTGQRAAQDRGPLRRTAREVSLMNT